MIHGKVSGENTLMKFYMDKTRKSPTRQAKSPEKVREEVNEDLALLNAEVAINLHYSPLKARPEPTNETAPTGAVQMVKSVADKKPTSGFERMMEVRRKEEQKAKAELRKLKSRASPHRVKQTV